MGKQDEVSSEWESFEKFIRNMPLKRAIEEFFDHISLVGSDQDLVLEGLEYLEQQDYFMMVYSIKLETMLAIAPSEISQENKKKLLEVYVALLKAIKKERGEKRRQGKECLDKIRENRPDIFSILDKRIKELIEEAKKRKGVS